MADDQYYPDPRWEVREKIKKLESRKDAAAWRERARLQRRMAEMDAEAQREHMVWFP